MKNYIRNKKLGLFLSVEMVVVTIIIVVVVVAVATSAGFLKNQYKLLMTVNEVQTYIEGVTKYKRLYGYWPGDMPKSHAVGEFNDVNFINAINLYNGSGYTDSLGTGFVGREKAVLAVRALDVSKIVQTGINAKAITSFNEIAGPNLYPESRAHPSTYIAIGANSRLDHVDPIPVRSMYLSSDNANVVVRYPPIKSWINKGSLVHSKMPSTMGIQKPGYVTILNIDGGTMPFTPKFAATLDAKIDDGLPSGSNSNILGEGIHSMSTTTIPSNAKCLTNSAGVFLTAFPATSTESYTTKYSPLNDNDGFNGCVLTFKIDE